MVITSLWNLETLNFRSTFQFCKCSCSMFMTWSLRFSKAILTFWVRLCYSFIHHQRLNYKFCNYQFDNYCNIDFEFYHQVYKLCWILSQRFSPIKFKYSIWVWVYRFKYKNVKTAFHIFGQPTDHHSVNDASDIHSLSSLLICLIVGSFWYVSRGFVKNFVQDD
jgi:hypothetical protein